MKQSDLVAAIKALIVSERAPFVSGPPGVGKSDTVGQVAVELSRPLVDLRTTLLDPVDLRGVPSVVEGKTRWNPPEFLPTEPGTILFLDELPNAERSVQSALLQLVLDRRLGEYELPDDCPIIAAGNRVEDRAGSGRLISSLQSRFVSLAFDVDLNDWVTWASGAGIQTEIIAFLRFRPALLLDFDPARAVNPNPRGWASVSAILPNISRAIEHEVITGVVGEGAATELSGFLRIYRDLPDPDGVLLAPDTADVPEDPATLYALCGALARKAGAQVAERLIRYAQRLPAEFNVLLVTDSIRRDPAGMQQNRAFQEWTAKNSAVLA